LAAPRSNTRRARPRITSAKRRAPFRPAHLNPGGALFFASAGQFERALKAAAPHASSHAKQVLIDASARRLMRSGARLGVDAGLDTASRDPDIHPVATEVPPHERAARLCSQSPRAQPRRRSLRRADGSGARMTGQDVSALDTDAVERRLRAWMVAGLDGDATAHHRLLSALSGYLRGYFVRRLGADSADAEDLVQETLLAIHLKRATYDRSLPFTPWAYAVARYKLVDHVRRIRRRVHVPLEDAGALLAANTPEEGAVRSDLERLLGQLPDRQRALIEEVRIQGFSVEEAARKRGVTAGSARVMLHRSLQWLNRRAVRD
jgi:RNA polymerase sigma-70 factor (ECF subfamily)